MSDIQVLDIKSSFIFVDDLNVQFNSVNDNHCYGIGAFDFANLSRYVQLIKYPTHKLGNFIDSMVDLPHRNSEAGV